MRKEVAVAAPTGVAAVNLGPELGAQTVHSLAGVGVPQTASGFEKMLSPWTAKKWKKIEVLVLDEIGMLGADFLDWMDVYVRKARKKPLEVSLAQSFALPFHFPCCCRHFLSAYICICICVWSLSAKVY